MKRYAIAGLGHRSYIYLQALLGDHRADGHLVGLCDSNPGRLGLAELTANFADVEPRTYAADAFDTMIAETAPDCVIVTVPDNAHADYIVRAMVLGCDVITEKPLTMDAVSIARIMTARRETGRALTVGFNYRYSPVRTLVKQVLMSGIIGHVTSASFEYQLDTHHGADYFRRWHRRRDNSGGLLVHKATHHFDLLNWWLGATPRRVTAHGRLAFYRPEMADALGLQGRGERCTGCAVFDRCGVRLDMAGNSNLLTLYADQEPHDGYRRDACVFSPEIDIEDTMNALIEYAGGIVVNYGLTAYSPAEGYRVVLDGTRGRLEHTNLERPHVQPDGSLVRPPAPEVNRVVVQPHFSRAYDLALPDAAGTHGGGDQVMLGRLFGAPTNDQYGHTADERAGAWSALVGIAANASLTGHAPVELAGLAGCLAAPDHAPDPFGPAAIWQRFDPSRYPFLEGATLL